ncbi:MAG: DUF4381 domain-containing protein [Pseudomonadota bacterium]
MNPADLPLRDIHLPDAPGWWPPAPGWWLLAALVILAAVGLVFLIRYRRNAISRLANREVLRLERDWRTTGDHRAFLCGLAATLRRTAIAVSGRDQAAGLVGDAWRRHLNAPLVDAPFDAAPGALLLDAAYRPDAPQLGAADVTALVELCKRWPRVAARGAAARGTTS